MAWRALLRSLPLLLAACGAAGTPASPPGPPAWPMDGFLRLLPEGPSLVARLPTADGASAEPLAHAALLRMLGRARLFEAAEAPEGLDRARAPGFVLLAGGASARYLPAADLSLLNRSLGALATRVAIREEGDWVVLEEGAAARGKGGAAQDALPPGDLALRVHHHPLMHLFASPGDRLDLGLALADGGIEFQGRYVPGPEGDSAQSIREAVAGMAGLVDLLPGSLSLRVETVLPPLALASFAARRVAVACGIGERGDRVLLERLLREALSGIDPSAGFAFGFEFKDGEATLVLLGLLGSGPPSPLLAQVRQGARWTAGALVVDRREVGDLTALALWVAGAAPSLAGVPETAWPLVGALCDERGLPLAYAEQQGWFVFAAGPRADTLARTVRQRLAGETTRSDGGSALQAVRERGHPGEYLLGVVWGGQGAAGLAPADRAALAEWFGAGPGAAPPHYAAVAGFRDTTGVRLLGRLLYALP